MVQNSNTDELINVIVPVYNSEKYLVYCLNSILKQNKKQGVIFINDGSTDKSLEILNNFSKKYSFVRVLNQENSKQAAARNNGIMYSNSEYIAFLDSDDQWTPNHLELCLNELEKNNLDIVSTGFYDSYDGGDMLLDRSASIHPIFSGIYEGEVGVNQFILSNKVATSTVVMRREVIEKIGLFDTKVTSAEDFDLWIRAIQNGFRIKVLEEPTMFYRHHHSSSTSNTTKRWSFNEEFYVINKNFTKAQISKKPFDVRKSLARKYKNWVRFSHENSDINRKFFYFWKFSGLQLDIKLLILFTLGLLRIIKDSKLNSAITSRLNVYYKGL